MGRFGTVKILLVSVLLLSLQGCCWFQDCEECYKDPNLFFPYTVTNIEIARTTNPTFVGQQFSQVGANVVVFEGTFATNEFFSITRFIPEINANTTFFWNRDIPPAFNNLEEGEIITYYKMVQNLNQESSLECIFSKAREVTSVLDVRVRTKGGEIVGERTVTQTVLEIPSGQYGIFKFEFDFLSCGNYEFDIIIDPDGNLTETNVDDNNYTENREDFGFCF